MRRAIFPCQQGWRTKALDKQEKAVLQSCIRVQLSQRVIIASYRDRYPGAIGLYA